MKSRVWIASTLIALGCASPESDGAATAAQSSRLGAVSASSAPAPSAGASSAPTSGAGYSAALDTLERALDTQYSYRDRLGLDWKAMFAKARERTAGVASRDAFVEVLVDLLAPAKDAHMDLVVDGKFIPTDRAQPAANISLKGVQSRVADWKNLGRCLSVGRVRKLAYVLVNGLENGRCDSLPADWSKAFVDLEAAPGMILDLRGNTGGNEVYAQAIAGSFVRSAVPYLKNDTRDAREPSGFGPRYTRTLEPAVGARRYSGRVVVLIGPLNMSSAESFALMMRAAGAKLLGARTRGASANPKLVDLGLGISVRVASWRALLLDGTLLEGNGVSPDREIPVTAEDVAAADPIIDAAAEELERPSSTRSDPRGAED